jgi:hypothetical protein
MVLISTLEIVELCRIGVSMRSPFFGEVRITSLTLN